MKFIPLFLFLVGCGGYPPQAQTCDYRIQQLLYEREIKNLSKEELLRLAKDTIAICRLEQAQRNIDWGQ